RNPGRAVSPPAAWCRARDSSVLLPFQGSLFPRIDKAKHQLCYEHHHRRPAGPADLIEADRPRIKERRLQIEDDEQDRDEIETHVKLAARLLKGREAAFIF